MHADTGRFYLNAFIISTIAIALGFSLFSFNIWPCDLGDPGVCKEFKKMYKDVNVFDMDLATQKASLMCDAAKDDKWYARQAGTSQFVHSLGMIAIILLTLATSFLLGSGWTERSPSAKLVSIALPLVSAAVAATLSQFGLRDATQLREFGRIEARKIYFETSLLDVKSGERRQDLVKLRERLSKLEADQAEKYYSFRYSDTPAKKE
jgi:uncharacterized membrane protein